jgi:hypothetical protein
MKSSYVAALALCAAAPAFAVPVSAVADFESVTSFASISSFYNGGTDSAGATGPNLGLGFGGDALALANDALGPYFSNAPSPLGVMMVVGGNATLDVADGFVSGLRFAYSSTGALAGGVQVWSGLGGTGSLLASFDLGANAQAGGCSDSAYCHFDSLFQAFNGTAYSVTFGNAANLALFDDVQVGAVPEPSSALLLALGLGGLAATRRRRA